MGYTKNWVTLKNVVAANGRHILWIAEGPLTVRKPMVVIAHIAFRDLGKGA